ncbi:comF family protein [Sphingomonas sp. YR710]|uniref:ComF family protein n=1 Tax=Sphingomonas sp. YR710 TaxID=1882773 RepID=UPI00088D54E4|nr:ComF family protein [Sphingomonas sp. YR710]SDD36550.1 comF family protein [Sphingomonas sp. YR710]
MQTVRRLGDRVVRFALPPRCPGCGVVTLSDHDFCLACWSALDFLDDPQCALCGDPFEIDPGRGALCGACHADPPAIEGMRAAVSYGPIARRIALRLKYGRRPGFAETMARHMRRHLPDPSVALLVPVPLHRWRIWRRGYNQAALVARALAQSTGAPIAIDLLWRRKATPILRAMGPAARRKAVQGVFALRPDADVKGKAIILIDDVYTTGATVNACARVLKRAGAARVSVLCWARVVRDDAVIR